MPFPRKDEIDGGEQHPQSQENKGEKHLFDRLIGNHPAYVCTDITLEKPYEEKNASEYHQRE